MKFNPFQTSLILTHQNFIVVYGHTFEVGLRSQFSLKILSKIWFSTTLSMLSLIIFSLQKSSPSDYSKLIVTSKRKPLGMAFQRHSDNIQQLV